MTITWLLLVIMVAVGIIAERRKKERFAFFKDLLLLAFLVVLSTLFFIIAIILLYFFSTAVLKMAMGSLFVLYGLIIILAGIFLFVVLKGVARWQPLSNTVLTLIEYYIQWSLIYATIYQIIFDNLLKTLQIVKNVSALTTISSNVVLVAVLSSFIASWLGIILYKFTKEKI
ncbi:SA1002 family membrane protein [Limosilactobacillus ingluviei]